MDPESSFDLLAWRKLISLRDAEVRVLSRDYPVWSWAQLSRWQGTHPSGLRDPLTLALWVTIQGHLSIFGVYRVPLWLPAYVLPLWMDFLGGCQRGP